MLSDGQRALLDAGQARVLEVLRAAEDRVAPGLLSFTDSSELVEERGAVRQARQLYDRWADAENGDRHWVELGHWADGRVYRLEEWLGLGDTIGQGASYAAGQYFASGAWKAGLASLAEDVADTVKVVQAIPKFVDDAANKAAAPWTWTTKFAVGGILLGGVLLGANALLGKLGLGRTT